MRLAVILQVLQVLTHQFQQHLTLQRTASTDQPELGLSDAPGPRPDRPAPVHQDGNVHHGSPMLIGDWRSVTPATCQADGYALNRPRSSCRTATHSPGLIARPLPSCLRAASLQLRWSSALACVLQMITMGPSGLGRSKTPLRTARLPHAAYHSQHDFQSQYASRTFPSTSRLKAASASLTSRQTPQGSA